MIEVIVTDDSPELFGKLQDAVSRFRRKAIFFIEGEVKSSMAEPKSGAEYKRGESVHVASAPGESPANDSSNLSGTIQTFFYTLEAIIGTMVEYGEYLEDGTDKMEARPVWEKTLQENLPTLENLLAYEIKGIQ